MTYLLPVSERLMTPAEVRILFRVDARTVRRWADSGWLSSRRTPGGQRRYSSSEVHARLEARQGRRQ